MPSLSIEHALGWVFVLGVVIASTWGLGHRLWRRYWGQLPEGRKYSAEFKNHQVVLIRDTWTTEGFEDWHHVAKELAVGTWAAAKGWNSQRQTGQPNAHDLLKVLVVWLPDAKRLYHGEPHLPVPNILTTRYRRTRVPMLVLPTLKMGRYRHTGYPVLNTMHHYLQDRVYGSRPTKHTIESLVRAKDHFTSNIGLQEDT